MRRPRSFHIWSARAHDAKGLTLLEALVALAITSIVGVTTILSLPTIKAPFDRLNARAQLVQDLKRAQAEAVTVGCRGIFRVAANGESYSFGCDLLPYDEDNPPQEDVVSFSRSLPHLLTMSVSGPIIFNSRGNVVDPWGDMTNIAINLNQSVNGAPTSYVSATLLGTGALEFN
jgi:type II secretory pathway pseudopilin PulG